MLTKIPLGWPKTLGTSLNWNFISVYVPRRTTPLYPDASDVLPSLVIKKTSGLGVKPENRYSTWKGDWWH